MAGDSAAKVWQGKILARIDKYTADSEATGQVDIEGVVDRNSLEIRHGSKETNAIPLMNEGNIYVHEPEGMTEISFDMYTKHTSYGSNSPEKIFFSSTTADADSEEMGPSHLIDDRLMCRLVLLLTNESSLTNACGEIGGAAGNKNKRYIFADCFITNLSSNRSDNVWRTSVTLKMPPSDAESEINYEIQSIDAESTVDTYAALDEYNATQKW